MQVRLAGVHVGFGAVGAPPLGEQDAATTACIAENADTPPLLSHTAAGSTSGKVIPVVQLREASNSVIVDFGHTPGRHVQEEHCAEPWGWSRRGTAPPIRTGTPAPCLFSSNATAVHPSGTTRHCAPAAAQSPPPVPELDAEAVEVLLDVALLDVALLDVVLEEAPPLPVVPAPPAPPLLPVLPALPVSCRPDRPLKS